jgi:hypothetical protein
MLLVMMTLTLSSVVHVQCHDDKLILIQCALMLFVMIISEVDVQNHDDNRVCSHVLELDTVALCTCSIMIILF